MLEPSHAAHTQLPSLFALVSIRGVRNLLSWYENMIHDNVRMFIHRKVLLWDEEKCERDRVCIHLKWLRDILVLCFVAETIQCVRREMSVAFSIVTIEVHLIFSLSFRLLSPPPPFGIQWTLATTAIVCQLDSIISHGREWKCEIDTRLLSPLLPHLWPMFKCLWSFLAM